MFWGVDLWQLDPLVRKRSIPKGMHPSMVVTDLVGVQSCDVAVTMDPTKWNQGSSRMHPWFTPKVACVSGLSVLIFLNQKLREWMKDYLTYLILCIQNGFEECVETFDWKGAVLRCHERCLLSIFMLPIWMLMKAQGEDATTSSAKRTAASYGMKLLETVRKVRKNLADFVQLKI